MAVVSPSTERAPWIPRALEIVGVATNLMYTWMYLQGQLPEAYIFAAIGAVALAGACWHRNLMAESWLHGFYLAMAGYGAWLASGDLAGPTANPWWQHALGVALGALAWVALVPVLERRNSSMPRLDAFTTVFSVVATWWMVQWDPINWLHWVVIDAVSIFLYMKRGMPWGALLFAVYTALAVHGWVDAMSLA